MFDAPRKGPSTWCSKPGRKNGYVEPQCAGLTNRIFLTEAPSIEAVVSGGNQPWC